MAQAAEDKVDIETPLVGFVDDDGIVGAQHRVVLDLIEQDAIGHDLDRGIVARLVGEANLGADFVSVGDAELFSNTLCDGESSDTARLCAADQAVLPAAGVDEEFRDLSGLTGSCFTRDDDDLVVLDRANDLLPSCMNREVFAVGRLEDRFDGAVKFGSASASGTALVFEIEVFGVWNCSRVALSTRCCGGFQRRARRLSGVATSNVGCVAGRACATFS